MLWKGLRLRLHSLEHRLIRLIVGEPNHMADNSVLGESI